MYWVSAQAAASASDNKILEQSGAAPITAIHSLSESADTVQLNSGQTLSSTISPSEPVALPTLPNTADQLIEVTLALALVIGLIYGAAWLIKRNKGFSPSAGIPMKTLSVLPMGVKEKIVLVEVGGKQILLGMTPHQINTLATFDDPIVDSTLQNDKPFSFRLKEMLNQQKVVEPKE